MSLMWQAAIVRNFRTFTLPIPLVLVHNLLLHIALIKSKDVDKQSMEVDEV